MILNTGCMQKFFKTLMIRSNLFLYMMVWAKVWALRFLKSSSSDCYVLPRSRCTKIKHIFGKLPMKEISPNM